MRVRRVSVRVKSVREENRQKSLSSSLFVCAHTINNHIIIQIMRFKPHMREEEEEEKEKEEGYRKNVEVKERTKKQNEAFFLSSCNT